jgi:UDP-N-acetylmuramoyl-L-alanyl-D-glutamate--2,6-diaminopimelate ligase
MNLLFDEIEVLESAGDPSAVEVLGVEHDSRRVVPGDLFCCLPGVLTDGHDFATEAVSRGAVGLICEHLIPELNGSGVVQTRVREGSARPAMARAAAAFYGHPARDLLMAGVTGTNGKTTVTQILGDILDHVGRPTNVVGTLSGSRTTPEATELQRLLAKVRDRQRSDGLPHAVAMEVSSHALVQSRVEGIHFDVAAFTNLSHDHLDFHVDMESYFAAKKRLFTAEHALQAVINTDDPWGQRLAAETRIPTVAVGRGLATEIKLWPGRTSFLWRTHPVTTQLTGAINVDNTLVAAESAVALGVDPADVAQALAHVTMIPGRLQVIAAPLPGRNGVVDDGSHDTPPFSVVIDYAHTPAGLEVVLREARGLTRPTGRVIVVFGCGGNRDRAKRPLMGAAASAAAETVFVTSDNPRREDPELIIKQVVDGIASDDREPGHLVIEADRRRAIAQALEAAAPGDVVVIAGKGHENYQEIDGKQYPFDDRNVATELLSERFQSTPASWVPRRETGR